LHNQQAVTMLVPNADLPCEIRLQLITDLVHAVRSSLDGRGISRHPIADSFADRAGPVAPGPHGKRRDPPGLCRRAFNGVTAGRRVRKAGYFEQAQLVGGQKGGSSTGACIFGLGTLLIKGCESRLRGRACRDLCCLLGTKFRSLAIEPFPLAAELL
jgi:hypothetical protein